MTSPCISYHCKIKLENKLKALVDLFVGKECKSTHTAYVYKNVDLQF